MKTDEEIAAEAAEIERLAAEYEDARFMFNHIQETERKASANLARIGSEYASLKYDIRPGDFIRERYRDFLVTKVLATGPEGGRPWLRGRAIRKNGKPHATETVIYQWEKIKKPDNVE